MADSRRLGRNIDGGCKGRLVTRSKWELPFRGRKPHWDKICDDIEAKVLTRVRNSSSSNFVLPPVVSSPAIRYSDASSVNKVYDFSREILDSTVASMFEKSNKLTSYHEPIIPIELSRDEKNIFSRDNFNVKKKLSSKPWRLTKLSKMTQLVNDFLSSSGTRVRPVSGKSSNFSSPVRKSSDNDRSQKLRTTREKSADRRSISGSKDSSEKLTSPEKGMKESKELYEIPEDAILSKRSVGFHDFQETLKNEFDEQDEIATLPKPRRPRAPSLSIASAVPSFGKVVISIEDIDSTENEEEYGKFGCDVRNLSNFATSQDYRETIVPEESRLEDDKPTRDFLKVPEVRQTGSGSYPSRDRSKFEGTYVVESRLAEEIRESNLPKESRTSSRKEYGLWPKKSLVHVFRALKRMKNGARSKTRMETEKNKFFAAPLDVYSPSVGSSISSDERNDFPNANARRTAIERNDEIAETASDDDLNGSRERIEVDSASSSYASVRERLMRNAVDRLPVDSSRYAGGTRADTDNALEVTTERGNPSSFYNSWATGMANNEVRRNGKTSGKHFVRIPRLGRIFPRVKADKCLACMYRSLKDVDRPREIEHEGTFLNYDDDVVSKGFESRDEHLGIDFSFDRFYRDRYRSSPDEKSPILAKEHPEDSLIPDLDSEKRGNEYKVDVQVVSTSDEPYRSRVVGKSLSKSLIGAKSLITSLSLMERSRSISDHDDSDQGCTDPVGNDLGIGSGSTSKYLAPCHMPINLKPSLEPLNALRSKKSRSIGSRVASAEKSVDSTNDEEESDLDDNVGKQPLNVATKRMEADGGSKKSGSECNPEDENKDRNKEEMETYRSRSSTDSQSKIDDSLNNDISNDESIICDREVVEISAKCLNDDKTVAETLRVLAKEFSKRLTDRLARENCSRRSPRARKNEKIAMNLLTLLADSKSYSNSRKYPNDLSDLGFSSKQPGLYNSRQLRRILPLKSYNLVAPILGMAEWYPHRKTGSFREVVRRTSRMEQRDESREKAFDLIVHPPSKHEQNVSFGKISKDDRPKPNPYSLFLSKPRRKAITWRPLTERDLEGYDPEATLKMRATKLTDRICKDFCQWLESLAVGTNQQSGIDVDVLKDMFETDFTAEVCSTMQIMIKEMPMVPTAVAVARNCPSAGELALTRRHLGKDARAETRPKRTVGFGTSLPDRLKFIPPRNKVHEKWLQCENVPKDLESMNAVWKDITHLESVQGFMKWLRSHPEVKRPEALRKLLTRRETIRARQSVIDRFKHLELDRDQIQSLKVGDNAPDAY